MAQVDPIFVHLEVQDGINSKSLMIGKDKGIAAAAARQSISTQSAAEDIVACTPYPSVVPCAAENEIIALFAINSNK